jgi:hypothetical protein
MSLRARQSRSTPDENAVPDRFTRAKLIGKTSCPVVDLAPRVQRGLSLDQHDLALLFGHRIVTNAFGNAS